MVSGTLGMLVLAVSARWSYEDAYDNVEGGAWYEGVNNEEASLAWGEGYVMSSLAAMYRATTHPMYLERLAEHIDAVLAQRDDARGVADYRGVSGACWRNMSYQAEPYCYAVHTGQIITPMLEFVLAVRSSPWAEQLASDGESFADKADRYLVAAQESVAFHEFEWDADGFYRFPNLASLPSPGGAQPLNQSNALGRAHILLAAITGDATELAKATALASYFRAQIDTGGDGAFLWNYRGGNYANGGEDISHAAINVEFGVMAAAQGIVFDQNDVAAFARTFTQRVYVNDATFADHVGGGEANTSSYRAQIGRWLVLAPTSPTVYAAVRDAYDRDYPAAGVASGSVLLGWALLAEHEPKLCAPFFYTADWDDQGEVREATAYAANIQTVPHDLDAPCLVPVEHGAPRATVVAQWDGDVYHRVASWTASGDAVTKHVPYDPSWPFVYASDGVLFQFEDAFTAGNGIVVHEPAVLTPPSITSMWPTAIAPEAVLEHVPSASGDEPRWWTLVEGPSDARIDPASGAITWTAPGEGSQSFVVRLDNRVGSDELSFEVTVEVAGADSSGGGGSSDDAAVDTSGVAGSDDDGVTTDHEGESTGIGASEAGGEQGCSCVVDGSRRAVHAGAWLGIAMLAARRRRGRTMSCA